MRTAEPVAFARLLKHYRVLAGLWTAPLIPALPRIPCSA